MLTGSRAGWGALALICVAALVIDWRLVKPMLKAGMLGTALILFIVYAPTISLFSSADADVVSVFNLGKSASAYTASDAERWRSFDGGLRLWQENPYFGAGLGAYFEETRRAGEPLVIHNTLIWLLAETGFFGFVVFFVIGATIFWVLKGRLRDPTDVGSTTMFLFLLAFAAMSMVHELLFQRVLWFAFGICLASVPASQAETKTKTVK